MFVINEDFNGLLEEINLSKIHEVMEFLNWKWIHKGGDFRVPTVEEMRENCIKLYQECCDTLNNNPEVDADTISTGGFSVCLERTGHIELSFILESAEI